MTAKIPDHVRITVEVDPIKVLRDWASSLECEKPTKKRIHPPASADSFTWERSARKFAPQDCRARGLGLAERCKPCRIKRLALDLEREILETT